MPRYEFLQDQGQGQRRVFVLTHQSPADHPYSNYPQPWIDYDNDTHNDDEWQERERRRVRRRKRDRDTEKELHEHEDGYAG